MDPEQYEKLSSQVVDIATHITNEEELLDAVRYVVGVDEAVLIRRKRDDLPAAIIGATPDFGCEWNEKNLVTLTEWYANAPREETIPGYFDNEGILTLSNVKYMVPGVGFGNEHDLVVVHRKKPSEPRESYHAWAIASLLRAFENIRKLADIELLNYMLDSYEANWGTLVRDDGNWSQISTIMSDGGRSYKKRPGWLYACYYLGNRARLRWAASGEKKVEDKIPEVNVLELAQKAADLLRVDSLVTDCDTLLDYCKEAWQRDLTPGAAVKEVADSREPPVIHSDWEKVCLLVLEHGWRQVLKRALEATPDVNALAASAKCLLRLSVRVIGVRLRQGWPDEVIPGQPSPAQSAQTGAEPAAKTMLIGRHALWGYLGILIAHADKLDKTYLDGDTRGNPLAVPMEPRHEFLLQLARFFSGLVERLEYLNRMDTRTQTVSASEVLDALLYLVDRYAHLQLGVDEWIDIRSHIGRAFRVEIDLHLASERYRDHLLHVIDVFLLGHLILHTGVVWTKNDGLQALFIDQLTHTRYCQGGNAPPGDSFPLIPKETSLRNWATASLLHDIGYQLSWNEKVPIKLKALRDYFDLSKLAPGSSSASIPDENPQAYLTQQTMKLRAKLLCDVVSSHPLDVKETSDHGVLSALRLMQILEAVGSQTHRQEAGEPCFPDYIPALHAIYHHNLFDRVVSMRTHPISCLLRICDELQEWGRHRVDIEGMVKKLYLAIEGERSISLEGRRILSHMWLNVRPSLHAERGEPCDRLVMTLLPSDIPHFQCELEYLDPEAAQYDATLTLLSKAYNLQHLDLSGPDNERDRHLRCSITLRFPRPRGYTSLFEYDLYTQFAKEGARWLPPFLPGSKAVEVGQGQGLLRLKSDGGTGQPPDRFAIVLQGRANPEARQGWLICNPSNIVESFLAFKRKYLRSRLG